MKYFKVIEKEKKIALPKGCTYRCLSKHSGIDYAYLHKAFVNKYIVSEKFLGKVLAGIKKH